MRVLSACSSSTTPAATRYTRPSDVTAIAEPGSCIHRVSAGKSAVCLCMVISVYLCLNLVGLEGVEPPTRAL